MIKTVSGDLIAFVKQGKFDVIVHGCNCFCSMDAGIAKFIAVEFPEAYAEDQKTVQGDKGKLGTCTFAEVKRNGHRFAIVNAYTQFQHSGPGPKLDYDALRSCMRYISKAFPGKRIGLPKIGAGLAGGDWEKISKIISEEMQTADVTIVEYR
jgi:O-acetyl-ADP-ribose deacetylase (regulator of RNase III)